MHFKTQYCEISVISILHHTNRILCKLLKWCRNLFVIRVVKLNILLKFLGTIVLPEASRLSINSLQTVWLVLQIS